MEKTKHYIRVSQEELNNFIPEKNFKPQKKVFTFFLWGKKFTTENKELYEQVKSLK